jgi:acetyl esterase/lipase
MAPIDRRVRVWAWVLQRQGSVGTKSDADIIGMQSRHMPSNGFTNRMFGAIVPGTVVRDRTLSGPGGGELPVRVYRPAAGHSGPRPLILYVHGGGFVFGDLRMGDWMCSSVAATVGAVVVSVDYRLAPAHPFPAAVEDCYAALTWAAENAADLGAAAAGEPTAARVGVMGESAGGNLSAVLCLLARDRGGPEIGHQALLYPATDMTRVSTTAAHSLIISEPDMLAFRRLYLATPIRPTRWHRRCLLRITVGCPRRSSRWPSTIRSAMTAFGTRRPCGPQACRCGSPSTSACRTAISTSPVCAAARARLWPRSALNRPRHSASRTRRLPARWRNVGGLVRRQAGGGDRRRLGHGP